MGRIIAALTLYYRGFVSMDVLRSRSSTTASISSLALQESGYRKLCLYVHKADYLIRGDTFGLSDPYVRVSVAGGEVAGNNTKKTNVQKKTLTPVWNEQLEFWIKGDQFSIIIDVYDENKVIKDDFLGRRMLHVDFSERQPVVNSIPTGQTAATLGVTKNLSLKDKYAYELIEDVHLPHISELRSQFFLKRLNRRFSISTNRGTIRFSYVFVDSSEEYELVQSPSEVGGATEQATPTSSTEERQELPPGWEQRTDGSGRTFYVNHLSRVTSLHHPRGVASNTETTPTNQPPQRRAYMERHTSVEVIDDRTTEEEDEEEQHSLIERPPPADESTNLHLLDSVSMATHPHPPSPIPTSTHTGFIVDTTPQPSAPLIAEATPTPTPTPPVQSMASSQATPTATHQATPTAMPQATAAAMPQATPTSMPQATPTSMPQNPLLQPRVNLGATAARIPLGASAQYSLAIQRAAQDLPEGWQAGMTPDGRIYYMNHISKTTTWEKPRLQQRPIQPMATRTTGATPIEQDSTLPEGWEQRGMKDGRIYYVDHNTRTTSWLHPTSGQEDLGPMPPGWEMKQIKDGRLFFVDHTTHSTQWEDPRLTAKNNPTAKMQYSRDYKQKYSNFRQRLPRVKPNAPNVLELPVRRDNVFEDSFRAVTNVQPLSSFHSRLYVKFGGESGLDYGGLAREWFFLLSHEMFSPYYGLFEYAASDDYTLQISPESGVYNEHHLDYFKFIGRMLGLATYHQHLLDAFFIRPFYKMILGNPVTLDDMQSVDEELYNSVQYILENDPEPLCLTFSANKTVFGQVMEEELKEGGKDIAVIESNKREYINLLIKWRFTDRVQKQIDSIKQGISDIFPLRLLKVFDARELEYLLGGLSSIDVNDWRNNTELMGYTQYDQVIVWFWKAVENYDVEMRSRLLQFVTGTSRVPMNGFAELQGSNGPRKFSIKRYGSPNSLPRSHTCFNRIDLPPYTSYHKLKEQLKLAVENTEGFEGVD